eukprot:5505192-Amphidinium_carterae.1
MQCIYNDSLRGWIAVLISLLLSAWIPIVLVVAGLRMGGSPGLARFLFFGLVLGFPGGFSEPLDARGKTISKNRKPLAASPRVGCRPSGRGWEFRVQEDARRGNHPPAPQ